VVLVRIMADRADRRGNLDLVPYLGFLGKTQIQILSFITSAVLLLSHTFTSWAVKERVLLRDEWVDYTFFDYITSPSPR
jgi:hypothetical protein